MSSTRTAEPPLYTITTLAEATTPTAVREDAPVRMRLWRRAVIGFALATFPAPLVATVVTGHAGWTPALFFADVVAIVAAVVSHALAEGSDWCPEQPVEMSWVDDHGNRIRYLATPPAKEAH